MALKIKIQLIESQYYNFGKNISSVGVFTRLLIRNDFKLSPPQCLCL